MTCWPVQAQLRRHRFTLHRTQQGVRKRPPKTGAQGSLMIFSRAVRQIGENACAKLCLVLDRLGRLSNPHCDLSAREHALSPREFIAFYRRCAAYCLEISHEFEDPGCKAALLSMAQNWTALADQVERAWNATHGIRT